MLAARAEETGSSFLPLEQHRVVAISTVLRSDDQLQVWSLGAADSTEEDLIRRFFSGLEKLRPTLVSWNGSGFDLPVSALPDAARTASRRRPTGTPARTTATSSGTTT